MIRYGIINTFNSSNGLARVEYEDDGTLSHEINVLVPCSGSTKYMVDMEIGDRVAVLCDHNDLYGVVLGGIYSAKETKPSTPDGGGVISKSGTIITYDGSGNVEVRKGAVVFKVDSDGVSIENGSDSLKSVLTDILQQIQIMTHNVTAPGAPTGPPINAAAFAAISTRIQALLG